MDNSNKKILTVSYLIIAAILAYSLGLLMEAVSSLIPGMTALTNIDAVRHGIPVVIGAATFVFLQFNKNTNQYCDEVVTEIKKIVWPSRKDTVAMTIVVCALVVFAGFALAVFDGVSGYLIGHLGKIPLP